MRLLYYIGLGVMLFVLPAQARETVTPSAHHLMATYTNERPYSQVAWLTSHNAYANARDGWFYTQQTGGIKEQFDYGVRSFMIDVHPYDPGTGESPYLALCHGECPEMGRPAWFAPTGLVSKLPPTPFNVLLKDIYELLEEFPKDILTLDIESGTPDNTTQAALQLGPYFTKAELDPYLLHLAPGDLNPNDSTLILGKMREWNRRLVVFSDKQHDHVFSTTLYRETQYSLGDYSGCEMREDERDTNRSTQLFVFNHFYTFSYESLPQGFDETNSFWDIQERLEQCQQQEGIYPTFVAVDFVEKGDYGGAREAVLWLNGGAGDDGGPEAASIKNKLTLRPDERPDGALSAYWFWALAYMHVTALTAQMVPHPDLAWVPALAGSGVSAALLAQPAIERYLPSTVIQPASYMVASFPFFYYVYPFLLNKIPVMANLLLSKVPVMMGALTRPILALGGTVFRSYHREYRRGGYHRGRRRRA